VAVGTHNTIDGTEVMVMRWLPDLVPESIEESALVPIGIYPVPAMDRVTVVGVPATDATFELLDMGGRLVARLIPEGVGNRTMRLPVDLQSGMYALRVRSSEGVRTGGLVVQY